MRRTRSRGLSRVTAGLLLVVAVVVMTYFGFTKAIPFRQHFEVKADFRTSNNLRTASLVRIAGVNVGKVTAIEPLATGKPGVRVTMRIDRMGRPLHKDATVALRPRIFLEGNLFVELRPGSPTAPLLGDGEVIPVGQTTTPVQIDQVLTALQEDTRADLVRVLAELASSFSGQGALGYNRAVQYWEPAFKGTSVVNDATLGTEPHDLSRFLTTAGRFSAALDRHPPALKSLITEFDRTAGALAAEQEDLERTIVELPRTLRVARPALASLNSSFPPLRRLTADLRPAVRSTGPTVDASLPFIAQVRGLVSEPELRGLSHDLATLVPDLAQLNDRLPGLYQQVRLASSCQNEVILPWSRDRVGDPIFEPKGQVFHEAVKNLPGLAAESRAGDANGQWARVLAGNGAFVTAAAGRSAADGARRLGLTSFRLDGVLPGKSEIPEIRYDVPCETQERPNLNADVNNPPPLLSSTSIIPQIRLPLVRMGEIMNYEHVANLLEAQGNEGRADQFRRWAKQVRKRYKLEDKEFEFKRGLPRIVDDPAAKKKKDKQDGKGKDDDGDEEPPPPAPGQPGGPEVPAP